MNYYLLKYCDQLLLIQTFPPENGIVKYLVWNTCYEATCAPSKLKKLFAEDIGQTALEKI
mgnify:CR=1 FL=1